MAWFKVDDTLHCHPKVRRAGAASAGVWVTAGSFCMAYKTDGVVPTWWLDSWGRTGRTAAAALVREGLWEAVDGGYRFHDWDDYQPLSDEIEQVREKARERQRKRRQSLAGLTRPEEVPDGE